MDDSYKKNKQYQLTSTGGVDIILCNLRYLTRDTGVLYTYLNISLQKRNVGTGSFYMHDVLSERSVSMIYNVTNIKLIYLIFLKEILSVDIQIVYIGIRS